jgi:SHAQKYF class myb-like DNA-binding protein
MARCHRIGQTKEVKVYRLITNGTYEYELFQSASRKAALDEVLIGGGGADMDDDDDEDYGGYASYDEDGENRRVNGGQKTKKKKNEAERITALLQKGLQFARMGESANEESKRFEDEDIDTILTKRADVKTIGPKKGNAFSTFTFDAREEEDKKKFGDDVDPAEYWKTMFPEAARKAEEEKKNRAFIDESLIVYGRRNRVSTISENLNLSLLEGGRSRGREKRDVTYDPSSEKERRPDGRGKNCWTTREIKIVYDSIFTYGCPYEDTRRVVFSREVREGIAEVSGRSEQDIKAVARSLLGIFDVLRKDSSVTAQTLANTDSLFTNAFPRSENLLADVKKAFENRQSRLFERKNLADLFEKTRTDEDYVWKADELPTLKNEEEISDVSMLKAQTWYSELLLPTRSWTVQHDLALLRGSLEIGFTPWNFAKSSEQFEAIYHEKQIGSITVDASVPATGAAAAASPGSYRREDIPSELHPPISYPPSLLPPIQLEEFKSIARARLPHLLSKMNGKSAKAVQSIGGAAAGGIAAVKLQWGGIAAVKLQWTHELKEKLYSALEELMTTHKLITPKNLWDEMRVTELTRDHIASYLQRVRKNEVNRPDLFSRLHLHEKRLFDQQNRNYRQTFLNKFGDSDGVVKEKPEKKYAPIRLAATRLWYAEEELKKLSRKNSRSLDEMETDHYRKKQDLLVMQDAEVKAKIQCGISDEYLGALQRANQMNMAQFSANLDMERESFMKNAREEEELLRINIKQRETELKEATLEKECEQDLKEVITKEPEEDLKHRRREKHHQQHDIQAEVIELISDDSDDDE